jgi:ribosomal protein S12 methylthiotransferase accessory factor
MELRSLRAALMEQACGFRCGIIRPVTVAEVTLADLPGVFSAVTEADGCRDRASLYGGVGRTPAQARAAAVGEALERHSAATATLPLRRRRELEGRAVLPSRAFALFAPEQHAAPGFPWPAPDDGAETYAPVFSLHDNAEVWVPQELVALGSRVDPPRLPSTSTGLAAFTDPLAALLRGAQELLERDALAVTWLNALPGRELRVPAALLEPVRLRGGEVRAFDLTQRWNPHPVVAVCGHLPMRGWRRIALGVACRATFEEAVESAYREWVQGVLFVGYHLNENPDLRLDRTDDVRDFIEHGVYYALHPERWGELPLLAGGREPRPLPPPRAAPAGSAARLAELLGGLAAERIRLLYRDLTPPDVARLGVTVVRVLSPDLTLLHADERAPFLGGRTRDVAWRYPGLEPALRRLPSPFPHPLG